MLGHNSIAKAQEGSLGIGPQPPFPYTRPLTFVDVFAGAGGLSLGLLQAGLRGLFAVEREPNAFETLRFNLIHGNQCPQFEWPEWLPEQPHDIGQFLRSHGTRLLELRGSVDVLAGGPPCQGFSPAGRRRAGDPRNRLFKLYAEMARLLQPTFLIFENVPWIAIEFGKLRRQKQNPRGIGRPPTTFAERIRLELGALGYRVFVLNEIASDFGVPQARRRYLIIGIRGRLGTAVEADDLYRLLRQERNRVLQHLALPLHRTLTVREAISDLESAGQSRMPCADYPGFEQIVYPGPRTGYQRSLHRGLSRREAPNSMRLSQHRPPTSARFAEILATCRKGVAISPADRERLGIGKVALTPLHPDRPSKTLTSLPDDFLHYSEPRILTVREYARLQSFPDWFEFKGRYTTGSVDRKTMVPRFTQVANAVPPLLARAIGAVAQGLARQTSTSLKDERQDAAS